MKNRSIRKVLAGLLTIVTVAAFTACGNKESGNGGQCDNCCENNASAGASSGTSSIRRAAMVKELRPDLRAPWSS